MQKKMKQELQEMGSPLYFAREKKGHEGGGDTVTEDYQDPCTRS